MGLQEKYREYHFEFKHLTVLFAVIFAFQLLLSVINKSSIEDFLTNTQEWYQLNSAEELANLTSMSLELLIETIDPKVVPTDSERERMVQSFNIVFSQQFLQHNIKEMCVIVKRDTTIYSIDDGRVFYDFIFGGLNSTNFVKPNHINAVNQYKGIEQKLKAQEEIISLIGSESKFDVFVPLVLRGEFIGALYMEMNPDFSTITDRMISNYDETSIIFLSLILLGLLAMYFISSYTVKERDEAQKQLLDEHETIIKKEIEYEKESLFAKRIYHTHHKAEKIMGFIKEDLSRLDESNIQDIKYTTIKYSNFISRVIYDMKWYDPPLQTVRNNIFNTNLNEVILFIVNNIFLRNAYLSNAFSLKTDLDENLPRVPVNEFVVWEIIEPLIQNCIEHGNKPNINVVVATRYNRETMKGYLSISDDGYGFPSDMLATDEKGTKRLFLDTVSTKKLATPTSGYGCYIALEMVRRCGWEIDALNKPEGGAEFLINIPNFH